MKEVLSINEPNKAMLYVSIDEKDLINRLFRLKSCAAYYYKQHRKIAYHWILNRITLDSLQISEADGV